MKINKIIIGIVIVAFLMAFVVAVDVLIKEREVSDEDFDTAESKGIDEYSRIDTFGEDSSQRKLISRSDFKLPELDPIKSYNIVCNSWREFVSFINFSEETNQTILTRINPTGESYYLDIIPLEDITNHRISCINKIRVNKTFSEKKDELDNQEDGVMDLIFKNIRSREEVQPVDVVEESEVILTKSIIVKG